jgi:hypothetical protein
MIYCPKCGTANRDGSRFCNECGEKLSPQTQVKCPQCGALNSVQSAFCSECGGRLLPSATSGPGTGISPTIKGLSLPTKASVGDSEEEPSAADVPEAEEGGPAWLLELGATMASAEADGSALGEDDSEIPDWLQDLRACLPEEPVSEAPLAEEPEEEVPDWSADRQPLTPGEEPEAEALVGEEPEEGEVPDWLAALRPSPEEEPEAETLVGEEPEDGEAPDWLAALRPSPEEEPEAEALVGEELEEGEVPDWLAELRPSPEEEPEAEALVGEELEEGEVPDWLAELRPSPEEEPEAEALVGEEPEEGEVPDWLAELRPSPEEEPEAEAVVGEEPEEGEVPDWLAELRPSPEEEPEAEVLVGEEPEEGEVPDWLAELRPSPEEEPEAEVLVGEELEEGEVPDWLAEVQPPALELESLVPEETEERQIPGWLAELRPPGLEEERAEVPPAAEERPKATAMPEWLEELQTEAAAEVEAPDEEELAGAELPDWLVPSRPEAGGEEEGLAPAKIPEWLLALKPQELRDEGEEAAPELIVEEAVEETGLLAGLHGVLPVEMLIAQPRAVTAAEPGAPDSETPQARLFAEIVGELPQAAPKAILQPSKGRLALLPRWIIFIALIFAVTLPLLVDESPMSRTLEPAPAVVGLYETIESLDRGSAVLVAFDYDPTTSGEMDVLSRAIVGHLMDREATVVTISLLPAGPATAQMVLDDLTSERPGYADAYGQQYVNLGYIPGQAAAVRLLGQSVRMALPRDFQNTPLVDLKAMAGLTTTQSFDLIVELAAAQDTLRWWIEQAGTAYGVPLGAGVSASVDPLARPYLQTEAQQLLGLVSGMPGAAVYEALRSGTDSPVGPTAARLDSQLAGHLVFLAVLLVGTGISFARRGNGRAR